MVLPRRFRFFFFFFCVVIVLSTFGLSSFYRLLVYRRLCYDMVLFHRLVSAFYPYENNSNMQDIFDQSNISNYGREYVKKLKLQIF